MQTIRLDPLARREGPAYGESTDRAETPSRSFLARTTSSLHVAARALALLSIPYFASGCAVLAQRQVGAIEAKHGVTITITPAAAAADLVGGNSLVALWNLDSELEAFPYVAKRGIHIHIAAGLDLFAQARTLGDVLNAPLTSAAVQDRPGKTQGHVYVLNKDLWGTYLDIFQPNTTTWQDPHLRHELMHAYEINALKTTLFCRKWQSELNVRAGELDEMTYKLAYVDEISFLATEEEIATTKFKPYVHFCARWLASMFGDVNGDGKVDEEDRKFLSANPDRFDADKDSTITYEDAATLSDLEYSFTSGINPVTQIEMTAGALGYRPRGFASPYGRTCPWEDKAEVLAFAIREKLLPGLYRNDDPEEVDKAYAHLERIRKKDAVFARKIEIQAIFFGCLEDPERRNRRFNETYGSVLVPFTAVSR